MRLADASRQQNRTGLAPRDRFGAPARGNPYHSSLQAEHDHHPLCALITHRVRRGAMSMSVVGVFGLGYPRAGADADAGAGPGAGAGAGAPCNGRWTAPEMALLCGPRRRLRSAGRFPVPLVVVDRQRGLGKAGVPSTAHSCSRTVTSRRRRRSRQRCRQRPRTGPQSFHSRDIGLL